MNNSTGSDNLDNTLERSFLVRNWTFVAGIVTFVVILSLAWAKSEATNAEVHVLRDIIEQHKLDAKKEHDEIQTKQERKWGDVPEIEQRVDDLEELEAYKRGVEDGKKK
jgi:uncharacterized protein YlxW (UPF0749 family)